MIFDIRKKEKDDVDKMKGQNIKDMFKDESAFKKQLTKEQVRCLYRCSVYTQTFPY